MPKFLKELMRRKVVGTVIGYLIIGWIIMQVLEVMVPALRLPESVNTVAAFSLILLFPFIVLFSWLFDITPGGIKLDAKEARSTEHRFSKATRRKLDYLILGGLVASISLFLFTSFVWTPGTDMEHREAEKESTTSTVATAENENPAAVFIPNTNSIAVLPFSVRSSGEESQYFADGLAEEIIMALSAAPNLLVVARHSSFMFRDSDSTIQDIAATLQVANILEGSIRRDDNRVRISARLIQVEDQSVIWSHQYEQELDDAWAIQMDIAENVVSSLGIILDETQREVMQSAGIRDVDAFIAFQRGLDLYAKAHDDEPLQPTLMTANEEFDSVIAINNNFTPAYLKKVDLYAHILMDQLPLKFEDQEVALAALSSDMTKAYLSERNPQQQKITFANRIFLSKDWTGLSTAMDDALAGADGCLTDLWLNDVAPVFGKAAATLDWNLKRLACDRLDPSVTTFAAFSALMLGDTKSSSEILRAQAAASEGRHIDSALLIQTLLASNQLEEAAAEFEKLDENGSLLAIQFHSALGNRDEVAAELAEFQKSPSPVWVYLPALAVAGEKQAANDLAAKIDKMPLGHAALAAATSLCVCGAPFELEATPNFQSRLEEADLPWPPASPINLPLKDW